MDAENVSAIRAGKEDDRDKVLSWLFRLVSAQLMLIVLSFWLLPQQLVSADNVTRDYVLQQGDVLLLTDDYGTESCVPLRPDGTAIISYAGEIEASGKTIGEVSRLVNEGAKRCFTNPNITVKLDPRKSTRIYVLGALARPGLYTVDEPAARANLENKKNFCVNRDIATGRRA